MNNPLAEIFLIDNAIRSIIEKSTDLETGEISEQAFEAISNMELTKEQITKNVISYYRECNSNTAIIDAEIKRLQDIKAKFAKQSESIEKYIKKSVPEGEKINTPEYSISWRKSESIEIEPDADIDTIEIIHPDFIRTKKELDKTAIKKYCKDADILPVGIKLIQKNNLIIK